MKKFTMALVVSVFLSTPAFAGIMKGWVESIYPKMNTSLIDTLGIYKTDGYILIGVGANYAAYSFKAKRLTKKQRVDITSAENDAGLVITYKSCPPQTGWLSGKITHASVAKKVSTAEELAEEIRELLEFTENKNFKPWGFGTSKQRKDQSFFGWNDSNGNSIEMQINKNIHQIKFQIIKSCKK